MIHTTGQYPNVKYEGSSATNAITNLQAQRRTSSNNHSNPRKGGEAILEQFGLFHIKISPGDASHILKMIPTAQQNSPDLLRLMESPLTFSQEELVSC